MKLILNVHGIFYKFWPMCFRISKTENVYIWINQKKKEEWSKKVFKHFVPLHLGLNEWCLSFFIYLNINRIVLHYSLIFLNYVHFSFF